MDLLLDTQILVWLGLGSTRLPDHVRAAIEDGGNRAWVSAVVAAEYCDLNRRGRFGADLPLDGILVGWDATVLDFPADAWRIFASMPPIHRDPVDRMLVAHTIHADLTLVTADAKIQAYPVRTLW